MVQAVSKHAHIFQHVPFEGIGSIADWLEARRFRQSTTCFFKGEHPPLLKDTDLMIIMGGPMSVNDEIRYPWLVEEKQSIRQAMQHGIPVIGICLGAQLIANALGARVYPNPEKEIGWFPVRSVSGDQLAFRFPPEITVFHWHGETFDLPRGATLLASSEGCRHQAFHVGNKTIGLQFHLETTPESARLLIDHARHEMTPSRYVQPEQEILNVGDACFASINGLMTRMLDYLVGYA